MYTMIKKRVLSRNPNKSTLFRYILKIQASSTQDKTKIESPHSNIKKAVPFKDIPHAKILISQESGTVQKHCSLWKQISSTTLINYHKPTWNFRKFLGLFICFRHFINLETLGDLSFIKINIRLEKELSPWSLKSWSTSWLAAPIDNCIASLTAILNVSGWVTSQFQPPTEILRLDMHPWAESVGQRIRSVCFSFTNVIGNLFNASSSHNLYDRTIYNMFMPPLQMQNNFLIYLISLFSLCYVLD